MIKPTDKCQLQGPERQEALRRFDLQIQQWNLTMPAVEPLVMDFSLGDFAHQGIIEIWIANEIEAGYCGKYLFVFDGQSCPTHFHPVKHETFMVAKGKALLVADGKRHELSEGGRLVMPPGQKHSFTGMGPALLLEVSTPSWLDDNRFESESVQRWQSQALSGS